MTSFQLLQNGIDYRTSEYGCRSRGCHNNGPSSYRRGDNVFIGYFNKGRGHHHHHYGQGHYGWGNQRMNNPFQQQKGSGFKNVMLGLGIGALTGGVFGAVKSLFNKGNGGGGFLGKLIGGLFGKK